MTTLVSLAVLCSLAAVAPSSAPERSPAADRRAEAVAMIADLARGAPDAAVAHFDATMRAALPAAALAATWAQVQAQAGSFIDTGPARQA